jgi:hypothetical protein
VLGWPALCLSFYWIGSNLQKGIQEYKEDRVIIRETKEIVDTKTDKALAIMNETKQSVDTMMGNHLHTIEGKVDHNNEQVDTLITVLEDIKENTSVMAALLKDREI